MKKVVLSLALALPLTAFAAQDQVNTPTQDKVPTIQGSKPKLDEHGGEPVKSKAKKLQDEHGGEPVKSKAKEKAKEKGAEHGGEPVKKKVDEHAGKAVQQ